MSRLVMKRFGSLLQKKNADLGVLDSASEGLEMKEDRVREL